MKIVFMLALVLTAMVSGCTRKSKAEAQARAAFMAGQQQFNAQMLDARRINVRIVGNVRNPEIPWMEEMTLAEAVVAAGYLDRHDPREIFLIRQGARHFIDPQLLLQGEDFPLMPGDTIELRR